MQIFFVKIVENLTKFQMDRLMKFLWLNSQSKVFIRINNKIMMHVRINDKVKMCMRLYGCKQRIQTDTEI